MSNLVKFAALIPKDLLGHSGAVFYSGEAAFSRPSPVYLLGINPGGDPEGITDQTVGSQIQYVSLKMPHRWSAYRDEQWSSGDAGTHGMQPRVLHLCMQLGLDPRETPASNLMFTRSRREAALLGDPKQLAEQCWPFHAAVIANLQVRLIVCFGQTVGRFVRRQFRAHNQTHEFYENNLRKWRSTVHSSKNGVCVATLTHPSIAAWTRPKTDPTLTVRDALANMG